MVKNAQPLPVSRLKKIPGGATGVEQKPVTKRKASGNFQRQQSYGSYEAVQARSGIFVIKSEENITKRVAVQITGNKDSLLEVFGDLKMGDTVFKKEVKKLKKEQKFH